jgi:preprotein translocase subunit SecF
MLVRTPSFGAADDAKVDEVLATLEEKLADKDLVNAPRWSGDRIYVRTKKPLTEDEAKALLSGVGLAMKDWSGDMTQDFATADEATGEYNAQLAVSGLETTFKSALEKNLGVSVDLIQSDAVGARAGKELRNDGAKSLFYAIALIMLYLAFRFDVRFAPGAVIALLHDAILVVGVFAVTWTDVSLTSVAALLTVIGYSVNDTVVIFDRVRENVERLKDKKLARVINISLNETLSRTLLTSITLFVVTVMMNIFGTGLVRNFAFAMNIGVVVGVYSSIFIASPVLLYLDTKYYGGRALAGKRGKKS